MSCTLTAALVNTSGERPRADVVQVGDSRVYHFQQGQLEQVTEDQTVARQLLQAGRIREQQLANHPDRNTLSQSIGLESIENPFEPMFYSTELQPGDVLLLCSDGLTDEVADDELTEIIEANPVPDQAARALIDAALEAGGRDNITVVLGRCEGAEHEG